MQLDFLIILILSGSPIAFEYKYSGIDICFNKKHPANALSPIEVTESGIDNVISDEHPEKA